MVSLVGPAAALGVQLREHDEVRLRDLIQLLQEWNGRFNLTAIRDEAGIELKHVVDSLAPSAHNWRASDGQEPTTLLDVGSGAGFPALPIAVVYPEVRVSVIEASRKKCDFIGVAAAHLGLNMRVVHGRAESEGRLPVLRERFDLVVARSVAYLPVLAEYCLPFVRLGGRFVAMKSEGLEEEIADGLAAVEELGGILRDPIPYEISGLSGTRWMLVVEKVSHTPDQYPRDPGVPKRSPITEKGGQRPAARPRARRSASPRR